MSRTAIVLALASAIPCLGCLDGPIHADPDAGRGTPRVDSGSPDSGQCPLTACDVHTAFPGDELCQPTPSRSFGALVHYGPDEYSDPDALTRYVVQPGTTATGNVASVILGPASTREIRGAARAPIVRASLTLAGAAAMTVSAGITDRREETPFATWSTDTFGTIDVQCRNSGDVPLLCEAWFLVALAPNTLSVPCAATDGG